MSADNGVYILVTIKDRKTEGNASVKCEPYKVYRYAYASAIDNFDYYKNNELYNLGAYMKDIWGKSEVFTEKDKVIIAAHVLAEKSGPLEYGVSFIETDMKFYGDF